MALLANRFRSVLDWVPGRWHAWLPLVHEVVGVVELTDMVCAYLVPLLEFKPVHQREDGTCQYDSTVTMSDFPKRPWRLDVRSTFARLCNSTTLTVTLVDSTMVDVNQDCWNRLSTAGSHRILESAADCRQSSLFVWKHKDKQFDSRWDVLSSVPDSCPTHFEFTDHVKGTVNNECARFGQVHDFSNHILRIELFHSFHPQKRLVPPTVPDFVASYL